ncbi:hypothetical protein [Streptomyces sp. NPDC054834]
MDHADAVRDVPYDGQVVGDEEVGRPQFLLQPLEQFQHPGLDRDVEGGDRLVQDEQFRLDGQGTGDADAPAPAAGELVRERPGPQGGFGDAD